MATDYDAQRKNDDESNDDSIEELKGRRNEASKLIGQAIPLVKARFKALVIYNEGSNFSVGANLGLAMFAVNIAAWSEIDRLIAAELHPPTLQKLQAALAGDNVFAVLMDAARVCSLQQVTDAFFEVGGQYRRNV